jgi:hypothetical protein
VPASSAAALSSVHFINAADAHACIVAHGHGLLVCDLEVAASVRAIVIATLEVLRLTLGPISGAAPDIGKAINITDESQWVFAFKSIAGGAPVNGVSRASVDDNWLGNNNWGAHAALGVCVAARVRG